MDNKKIDSEDLEKATSSFSEENSAKQDVEQKSEQLDENSIEKTNNKEEDNINEEAESENKDVNKPSLVQSSTQATFDNEYVPLSPEELDPPKPEKGKKVKLKFDKKEKNDPEHEPPLESLPDNLTDEEIELFMQEQQKHAQEEAEEDESEYENLSEEEIKELKERKRRFQELKARYNAKRESSGEEDIGDYRRNLDFSVNTSVKRFKVKPPKKPFIIAFSILFSLIIVGVVIGVLMINKPPEPVKLKSISISQTTTYQYVGENVDFRGLYLTKTYTDGTTEKVKVSSDMIARTSSNINNEFEIVEYSNSTFVYFKIENFEAKLDILLTNIEINGISANIYKEKLLEKTEILFNELLVLATIEDVGIKKIASEEVQLFIDDIELTKSSTGFMILEEMTGNKKIKVVYKTFSSEIDVNIELAPTEEPAA